MKYYYDGKLIRTSKTHDDYKPKVKRVALDLYPTYEDIKQRLDSRLADGEPMGTYLKRLIREDIARN